MDPQIWKFEIKVGLTTIEMPADAQVISAGAQGDAIVIWAIVSPDAPKGRRRFAVYGTGHPLIHQRGEFIGTVQAHNGLVWHVFELARAV